MHTYIKLRVACHSIFLKRPTLTKGIALFLLILTISCSSKVSDPAPTIPPPPTYSIYDEAKILNDRALRGLQSILIEHERLSGEQFLIGIFKNLGSSDLDEFTHQVFLKWKVGKRRQSKSVLLTIFLEEQKAKIETGYGTSSILTDEKAKEIASSIHLPKPTQTGSYNSLGKAVFDILETLNSPLILGRKAEVLLQQSGLIASAQNQDTNDSPDSPVSPPTRGWGALLLFGIGILSLTLLYLLSREAHFTQAGWYRPNLWFLLKGMMRSQNHSNEEIGGASGHW